MTVRKVDFVGLRTEAIGETVTMFRDLLGVPVTRETDNLVGFQLADGTVLEVYGPDDSFHEFFRTGPVVAFQVDDFGRTRDMMMKAGVRFIGEPQVADGHQWQHFHTPDGTVLELSGWIGLCFGVQN